MTPFTFTPAVICTGKDERGNLFSFWKTYDDKWVDGYNECETNIEFVRKHVFPNVQTVYFSDFVMTGAEWVDAGCPMWLSNYQIAELNGEHPADATQQIEREIDGILRTDSDNYLPHTNTNGNLQWQGVEFDIPAIVELIQAYSAELKAQIDARTAAVRSLNVQAVNNVRLGVKR